MCPLIDFNRRPNSMLVKLYGKELVRVHYTDVQRAAIAVLADGHAIVHDGLQDDPIAFPSEQAAIDYVYTLLVTEQ